MAERQGKDI